MRPDRFALIGAGELEHARALGGRDAEMVRPEPGQPLRKPDVGSGGSPHPGFRLLEEDLLRNARAGIARSGRRRRLRV
jgi:hypothetical protein